MPALDKFVKANRDMVFLVQPNYLRAVDKTYFFESDENKKYEVIFIKMPYYYMVKITLKQIKKQ